MLISVGRKLSVAMLLACMACASPEKWETMDDVAIRMNGLPLEEQWKIYLENNQKIHPPRTGLSNIIAKGGKPAAYFVAEQVRETKNVLDIRDSLMVFRSMEYAKYYDVCGDKYLMDGIHRNGDRISKSVWAPVYKKLAAEMCDGH